MVKATSDGLMGRWVRLTQVHGDHRSPIWLKVAQMQSMQRRGSGCTKVTMAGTDCTLDVVETPEEILGLTPEERIDVDGMQAHYASDGSGHVHIGGPEVGCTICHPHAEEQA